MAEDQSSILGDVFHKNVLQKFIFSDKCFGGQHSLFLSQDKYVRLFMMLYSVIKWISSRLFIPFNSVTKFISYKQISYVANSTKRSQHFFYF